MLGPPCAMVFEGVTCNHVDRENTIWNSTKCWIAHSDVLTTSASFGQPCSATSSVEVKDCAPYHISENQGVFQKTVKDSPTDKTHRPHNTFNLARSSRARRNFHQNPKQSMTEKRHLCTFVSRFGSITLFGLFLVLTAHLGSVCLPWEKEVLELLMAVAKHTAHPLREHTTRALAVSPTPHLVQITTLSPT